MPVGKWIRTQIKIPVRPRRTPAASSANPKIIDNPHHGGRPSLPKAALGKKNHATSEFIKPRPPSYTIMQRKVSQHAPRVHASSPRKSKAYTLSLNPRVREKGHARLFFSFIIFTSRAKLLFSFCEFFLAFSEAEGIKRESAFSSWTVSEWELWIFRNAVVNCGN